MRFEPTIEVLRLYPQDISLNFCRQIWFVIHSFIRQFTMDSTDRKYSPSPIEHYLMQEVAALTRRVDYLSDKNRIDRGALMRTQQYVLELECRLETMEEAITRLAQREHPMVQDAVEATLEMLMAEQDYDNTDIERILDDMRIPANFDDFPDLFEDNQM